MRRLTVLTIGVLLPLGSVGAQNADKIGYTLFNPSPRELWRPLSADRPDATESPITVDAGAVQLEASFFDYAHDSANGAAEKTDSLALASSNLKIGLLNNTDIQLIFAPYVREETRPDAGPATVMEGPSDLTVRLKVNFWGNDGGSTALGLLPFVKIPTGSSVSNDHVEGGFAVPFSWDIADGVGLGLMGQLDVIYTETTGDYDLAFLHSAVLGFDIHGPLGGYTEYVGIVFFDGSEYEASASVGLTYQITDNVVLDGGTLIGLTRSAPDHVVFTGITIRF